MGDQLSEECKRARSTIQSKWQDVARIRTLGWADLETAVGMYPFIRASASGLGNGIICELPVLIFMSREPDPQEVEIAIPYVDPNGTFNVRFVVIPSLKEENKRLLNEFAQALWAALAQQMLPSPYDGDALAEALLAWTGKELLDLSSAPTLSPDQGNNVKPPTTVEEWKALPELEIPAIKTPHERGLIIKVLKIGSLTVPPEMCRMAGLTSIEELRGSPPPARVALPTATVESNAGPKLYRLPQSLGDWAFTCGARAMKGTNPFPERVEFSRLDGRYTANILGSTYLALTDEELMERIRQANGEVMIVVGTHRETGHFVVGLRDQTTGAFLLLSTHTDEATARQAGTELEAQLDRIAAEHPNFRVRNLMDEAGDGKGRTRH